MDYTKKIHKLINAIWQTIKPFTERIDDGEPVDDSFVDQMVTAGADFAYRHKDISSAAMQPRPDQDTCDTIDATANAIVLDIMHLIGKYAEVEGRTMKVEPDDETETQTSMMDII